MTQIDHHRLLDAIDKLVRDGKPETMTLGEFITALEKRPEAQPIMFDFGGLAPDCLRSWRVDYSQLALGFVDKYPYPTVLDILKMAQAAVGATFTGWKGGDYTADEGKLVWVANSGDSGGYTGIVSVIGDNRDTVIRTAPMEYNLF